MHTPRIIRIRDGTCSQRCFNKATLANFVNVCERGGMPIQTFHAIGNHDHDMAVQNIAGDDDSAAELAYISALGPTYYAVNIGKVHYVVFDNTQYVNTGGDRSFAVRLNRRQMDWAQKDADYMHDLKASIQSGRFEDAEAKIDNILSHNSLYGDEVSHSGNLVIDSLINYKYSLAQKEGSALCILRMCL